MLVSNSANYFQIILKSLLLSNDIPNSCFDILKGFSIMLICSYTALQINVIPKTLQSLNLSTVILN